MKNSAICRDGQVGTTTKTRNMNPVTPGHHLLVLPKWIQTNKLRLSARNPLVFHEKSIRLVIAAYASNQGPHVFGL